jgi:predicted nucleic acid-binding protein
VTTAALELDLPSGERLLVDSSALIAYLDGREPASPVANHILDSFVKSGRNRALVSVITVTEVLVRPLRLGTGSATTLGFLTAFPNLTLVSVDLFVAQHAAMLRAQHGFKTPDALTIATGIATGAGHLVTNYRRWSQRLQSMRRGISVCVLEDYLPFP